MSLIGIDIGSSSVKAAAYSEDGCLLSISRQQITPRHLQPGWWEQDPEEVWLAALECLRSLARVNTVRKDPPVAIAISASGREIFPVDAEGNPLGPCLMGADIRGAEFEIPPEGLPSPEPWTISCGHLRERMDPVFRLLWWRKYYPEIAERARFFLGWHDFLAFRMAGRPVTERSLAGRFLVYDLKTRDWSPERLAQYDLDPFLLPELMTWGEVIGTLKPEVAKTCGLSQSIMLTVGGHDVNCCALGCGVLDVGTACLVSGSYENVLVPTGELPKASMLLKGLSVTPHMGRTGLSVFAISPTGNSVLNWARDLVGLAIDELDGVLHAENRIPSPVVAVPYLSGSMLYWENGRKAKGALLGLTLATSQSDVVQAFMESIAYDHFNTLSLLEQERVKVSRMRATGGGSRSVWWTQLKADLMRIPIEVIDQPEPGTLGAALLAGLALGKYSDLGSVSLAFAGTSRVFEPDTRRADLHRERLDYYRKVTDTLISTLY